MRSVVLLLSLLCILALLLNVPHVRGQPGFDDEPSLSDEGEEEIDPIVDDDDTGYYQPPSHDGPRAQLIIHKRLITPIPGLFAAHRPINVSIICYNVGQRAAHTLTMGDNWGDLFDIIEGTNSSEIETLEVGQSVELNFTVVPSKEGYFTGGAAIVSYQAWGEGSRLQQAYSSGYRQFTIYPEDVYDKYARSKTFEWVVLGIGLSAVIGIPLAIWSFIQIHYSHGIRKTKKSAKSA